MSRSRPPQHELANGVVSAVEQVAALYNVPYYRMNSGAMMVESKGKTRPMSFGVWHDDLGVRRTKGMADLLLTPRVRIVHLQGVFPITVPLWCECKYGTGELSQDQEDFRDYVKRHGALWVLAKDSADAVLEVFRLCHVERN